MRLLQHGHHDGLLCEGLAVARVGVLGGDHPEEARDTRLHHFELQTNRQFAQLVGSLERVEVERDHARSQSRHSRLRIGLLLQLVQSRRDIVPSSERDAERLLPGHLIKAPAGPNNGLLTQLHDLFSKASEVGKSLLRLALAPVVALHRLPCPFGEGVGQQVEFGVAMHARAEPEAFTRLADYSVQQLIFLLAAMVIAVQLPNLLVVLELQYGAFVGQRAQVLQT